MFDGSRWFQQSGRTPTLDDYDHQPFFRRHFWPPSALGIMVIAVLISMLVGFTGALIYTSSDNAHIAAVDPADQTRVAPTVPPSAEPNATTTTVLEVLTPAGISQKLNPSVWTVSSLDESGRAIEGSGFVAGAFGGQTFVLTSLSIVRAATRVPGPEIVIKNGNAQVTATLWTWQEDKDLALLVTGRSAPSIPWPDDNPATKAGDKIYVLPGGGGAPVAGVVSAVSAERIQHNVFLDDRRQGAPLLNERGQVLGMVTLALNPPGAPPPVDTFNAVPITAACERVLTCGSGTTSVAPNGPNATTSSTTATTRG
jgi:S1-C subfamily serine protease